MKPQYIKLEKIGEGACGSVYKAKDVLTNQIVAIKKFKELGSNEGIPQNCLREIQVLRTLENRKDVATAKNVYINESGHVYVIFDYYKCSLQKLISTEEQIDCRKFALQIIRAVDGIHDLNIVHRDIKPQNILMTNQNEPLLADFGFAKEIQLGQKMTNMVGTQAYRAPQLILGDVKYGKAVDIWSLGCTLYQIFSKKTLFDNTTQISHLSKIFSLFPSSPQPSSYLKSLPLYNSLSTKISKQECCCNCLQLVPEQFHFLLMRMLDINPQSRITAKQAVSLLK